ncbi:MAG: TlpA family protein disulfide reductase [Bacteroidetes bacterium]|nr:TlpA family protein disulfide reductase [Bacteroidota bacterium]
MKFRILVFLLLITAGAFAQKPRLHKEVGDFTLKTPEGENLRLSSLRGQVVLVDFWASWCLPCRASIPHLKELYSQYHKDGLEIVSISIDARDDAWRRAMAQEKMPWKQVMDSYKGTGDYSDMALSYGVKMIPYTLLVDKEGKAIAINPDPGGLDKELNKLFGH